jgi:hypothetical protein
MGRTSAPLRQLECCGEEGGQEGRQQPQARRKRGWAVDLAARPSPIAGKFILSVNDVPEMREVLGGFSIEDGKTSNSVAGGNRFRRRKAEM